jgi:hypothetical protein
VFCMPCQEKVAEWLIRPDLQTARDEWLSESRDESERDGRRPTSSSTRTATGDSRTSTR